MENNEIYQPNVNFIKQPIIFDKKYHESEDIKNITSYGFSKDRNKEIYEGKYFYTNQGYLIKVKEYIDAHSVKVQFMDTGFIKSVALREIRTGKIGNPFHRNICGGFFGAGPYSCEEPIISHIYRLWVSILRRSTNEYINFIYNYSHKCYQNVILCNEWLNFQNFAYWYLNKSVNLNPKYEYHIDKDFKQIGKFPKYYSPETCCLIPNSLNEAFTGFNGVNSKYCVGVTKVGNRFTSTISINNSTKHLGYFDTQEEAFQAYKLEKEKYIKDMATFYYNDNALSKEDYEVIMNIDILPCNN